jgi:hypothetical protein
MQDDDKSSDPHDQERYKSPLTETPDVGWDGAHAPYPGCEDCHARVT